MKSKNTLKTNFRSAMLNHRKPNGVVGRAACLMLVALALLVAPLVACGEPERSSTGEPTAFGEDLQSERDGISLQAQESWYQYPRTGGDAVLVVSLELQNITSESTVSPSADLFELKTEDLETSPTLPVSSVLSPPCRDDLELEAGRTSRCHVAFDKDTTLPAIFRYTGVDEALEVLLPQPVSDEVYQDADPERPGA